MIDHIYLPVTNLKRSETFYGAMLDPLRPSELFALRWKCFNLAESTMSVSETAYMGKMRPWGKTRKSLGVIHIPRKLTADLWRWKQQCPDPTPEAFIFPNKDGEFMDTGNYRKRVLQKLAAELGLPKLTFQVIRRNCHAGPKETEKRSICKYLKIWWTWSGSNRRPLPCHGSALPTAPQAH